MKILEGKAAVVTGGASGIGKAIVTSFVEEGGRVVIADIDEEQGKLLANKLGDAAVFVRTDVRSESDWRVAVTEATAAFGKLDCLCSNAGAGWPARPIEAVTVQGFQRMMDITVRAAFLGINVAAPIMKQQGRGSIVTVSSSAGFQAGYGSHFYSAAKAAVIQLTRSMAMELGESGIRVNCICPGGVATPLWGKACGLSQEESEEKMAAVMAFLADMHPLRCLCVPEDVARAAVWLAGDQSGFVNGHALVIDGGLTNGRMWRTALENEQQIKRLLEMNNTG